MEIASYVQECLSVFESLLLELKSVEDECGRFRVWAGNISAHRTGRRSLEYRLRDSSNLQATVTSLLKDLLAVLQHLGTLIEQYKLDEEARGKASSPSSHSLDDAPDSRLADSEDANLFGLDDEDASASALFAQALDEAREIITCLLRFSMTLRNPARHDELKQAAATTTKVFEPYDIRHVREKYPTAADFLHRRLGKAISKQRQYFRYREEHHQKLAEGMDHLQQAGHGERPSTIATSLQQSEHILAQTAVIEVQGDTESVCTATSFAPTTAGHVSLRPPPLPEAGWNGGPFECPLCYGIIVAGDEQSWRQHVYEDLPPYICPFESCSSADHRYSRRREWQRHQAKFHNRSWFCPFGCPGTIGVEADFGKHLAKDHNQVLGTSVVQRMADACAVPEEVPDLTCPLCGDSMPTSKRWYKHLGHHMEECALHALPLPDHVDDSSDGVENLGSVEANSRTISNADADDGSATGKSERPDRVKLLRPLYEGMVLERLIPRSGETLSWRRCGRRWLPYSQDELVALVKKHWKSTGTKGADLDFRKLNSDKQGIINRIIEEKELYEKSKTADWVIVDVQSIERRIGWSKEINKLQVIIKRIDKGNDKTGYAAIGTHSYPADDVIDLSAPLKKKKAASSNSGNRQSNSFDPLDDRFHIGFRPKGSPPQRDNRAPEYDDRQWDSHTGTGTRPYDADTLTDPSHYATRTRDPNATSYPSKAYSTHRQQQGTAVTLEQQEKMMNPLNPESGAMEDTGFITDTDRSSESDTPGPKVEK